LPHLKGNAVVTVPMLCLSSARYRCPLPPRGSTASSPKAAKGLTRIWSEQAAVAGGADAGFPRSPSAPRVLVSAPRRNKR